MRFLAVGLVVLGLLAATYPEHVVLLGGSFYDPHLLAFVHVNTLGLIASVVFGASYQMLPIVLQTPLASPHLARLSWWALVASVLTFVPGLGHGPLVLVAIGGTLAYTAIGLYAWVITATMRAAPVRDTTWRHVALATAALVTGATLGLLLAFSKQAGFLAGWTLPILAAHVALMLGGWLSVLLTGVAHHFVSMFTLTEDRVREDWAALELGLIAGGAWITALSLLLGGSTTIGLLGAASFLAGLGLFALHVARRYRVRLRRSAGVHVPYAVVAIAAGLVAAGLLVFGFATARGPADPIWIAVGWLLIVGWLETAIQGFLYKLGPFLTWLRRYAPDASLHPVPVLEQLYSRPLALCGLACWTVGVALGAALPFTAPDAEGWLPFGAGLALSLGGVATIANGLRIAGHWFGLRPIRLPWRSPVVRA
jgi:hypothetical protein